jgi:Tol biopolymer transport system component/pimeloyl-ACP methyl ester carboxylesterase
MKNKTLISIVVCFTSFILLSPKINGQESQSKIAFQSTRDGGLQIFSMNPDGSNVVKLTNTGLNGWPKWSPDGKKIAFVSSRDGNFEIYTMNADGSNQVNLTNNPAMDSTPYWCSNGRKIGFLSSRADSEVGVSFYLMDGDGSNIIDIIEENMGVPLCYDYPISPDGRTKVFADFFGGRDSNYDIFTQNVDGSKLTKLTDTSADESDPDWSPDGRQIVFSSERDGNGEIYVMNADGSNPINLTNHPSEDRIPDWSSLLSGTLIPQNTPPQLAFINDKTVDEGDILTFRVSAIDLDENVLTYSVNNLPEGANFNSSTGLFTWEPDFDQSGVYNLRFQVSDGKDSDHQDVQIQINDVPTIAADLVVTKIWLAFKTGDEFEDLIEVNDYNNVEFKDNLIFVINYKNQGEATASNWEKILKLDGDIIQEWTLTTETGNSRWGFWNVPSELQPGSFHTFEFILNPSKSTAESNYGNNSKTKNFRIKEERINEITGVVISEEQNRPIENAKVELFYPIFPARPNSLLTKKEETTTDDKGQFHFRFTSLDDISINDLEILTPGYLKISNPGDGTFIQTTCYYSFEDFSRNKRLIQVIFFVDKPTWQGNGQKQFYFLEMPDQINSDSIPLLLLHGLNGTSGYWGNLPMKLKNIGHDVWEIYYPGNQSIRDSAILLGNAIEQILSKYSIRKVNLVTHSMGGLVARTYTVLGGDGVGYKDNINKLLMIGPPHHGSEAASKIGRGDLLPELITWARGHEPNAPAYQDLSVGSNLIWELNRLGINETIDQLVVAGTKGMVLPHIEAKGHDDGVVAISSASLLQFGVPLALVGFNHADQIGLTTSGNRLGYDSKEIRGISGIISAFINNEPINQIPGVRVISPQDIQNETFLADYIREKDLDAGIFQAKFYDENSQEIDEGIFYLTPIEEPLKEGFIPPRDLPPKLAYNRKSKSFYFYSIVDPTHVFFRNGLNLPSDRRFSIFWEHQNKKEKISTFSIKPLQTLMKEFYKINPSTRTILRDISNQLSLEIPQDALREVFFLTINKINPQYFPIILPEASLGMVYNIGPDKVVFNPESLPSLTISYEDSDLNGFPEDQIVIYTYNDPNKVWLPLPGPYERDLVRNKITTKIRHLSLFCVGISEYRGLEGDIIFNSNRDGNWEVYVMNADGSNQRNITQNPYMDGGAIWSPEGTEILFVSDIDENREIYTMKANGENPINISRNSARETNPSWSPDGTQVLFSSNRDGNWEVYVMNADGSNQRNITQNQSFDSFPSWSPDGSRIAYLSARDFSSEIYTMKTNGDNQKRLTWDGPSDCLMCNSYGFSWSPDGKRIAFRSWGEEKETLSIYKEIYTISFDGSNLAKLTENKYYDGSPLWSPDGREIAFNSKREGDIELYLMDNDGGNQFRLTNTPFQDVFFSWSPDGRKIVYTSIPYKDQEIIDIYVIDRDGNNLRNLTNNEFQDIFPKWNPNSQNGNSYPVPILIISKSEDQVFTFDVSESYDQRDKHNLKSRIDFNGDNIFDTDFSYNDLYTYSYTDSSKYTITLQVKNTKGLIAQITQEIESKSLGETAVYDSPEMTPVLFLLKGNFPNPFNSETMIYFTLPKNCYVILEIYNINGQKIKTLIEKYLTFGDHSLKWNGKNSHNKDVSSGVYFVSLKTEGYSKIHKIALIK